MSKYLRSFFTEAKRNESGAALVEYALLVGLIAVVAVVAVQGVSTKLNTAYNTIGTKLAVVK